MAGYYLLLQQLLAGIGQTGLQTALAKDIDQPQLRQVLRDRTQFHHVDGMLARDIAQRDVTTLNPLHKLESAGIHTVLGDSIQLRGTHMSNSSILELSMTPDLSDERFAGNASGVAMQYKLWGIEQVRLAKERSFLDGLHRLLTALSGSFALLGTPVALEQGQVTFYKNLPQDHTALAGTLLSLSPLLSKRTILEQLPWVKDAEEELRRKAEETMETEE